MLEAWSLGSVLIRCRKDKAEWEKALLAFNLTERQALEIIANHRRGIAERREQELRAQGLWSLRD